MSNPCTAVPGWDGDGHAGAMTRSRLVRPALGAAVVTLLAAGCSGVTPLPTAEARAHYEQVRQDLVAAIGASDLSLTVREEPLVGTEDGACLYDPGSWEADGEAFNDTDASWQPPWTR